MNTNSIKMKREAPNWARTNDVKCGYNRQARDIAVLAIAIFLAALYLIREFYTPSQNIPISFAPSTEQTAFEVEYPAGVSRVYVYPKQESEVKSGSKIVINKDGPVDIGLMSGEKHLIFSIPLDINKATAQDFEALPGIGAKMAEQIIETKERLGGFKNIDDIKKVKGLGEKKFERIRELISIE